MLLLFHRHAFSRVISITANKPPEISSKLLSLLQDETRTAPPHAQVVSWERVPCIKLKVQREPSTKQNFLPLSSESKLETQSFAGSDHQRELLPFFKKATASSQSKQDIDNFRMLRQHSCSQIMWWVLRPQILLSPMHINLTRRKRVLVSGSFLQTG